jgi:hypothetical protein
VWWDDDYAEEKGHYYPGVLEAVYEGNEETICLDLRIAACFLRRTISCRGEIRANQTGLESRMYTARSQRIFCKVRWMVGGNY